MSFTSFKTKIEEGDFVMAYLSRTHIKPIIVKKGEKLNTRFGTFPHDSMIGLPYGSQLMTPKGRGFIYLLHPTPELWTMSLPHRTQIVYTPDSSYIVQRMGVIPGSRVIEAGTGSGSFTHAFVRTIAPTGKLFTYEFHKERYEQAVSEFKEHKLQEYLICTNRDVCAEGFDIDGTKIDAEAVFLDLPSPWEAIPHLKSVITHETEARICCFSPCVEQVLKTVTALQENGWTKIEMTEVSSLLWESRKVMIRELDDAIKRLKDVKKRQLEGIEYMKQMAVKYGSNKQAKVHKPRSKNRDRGFNPFGKGFHIIEGDENYKWFDVSKEQKEIKTHTSYLTFAIHVPQLVVNDENIEKQEMDTEKADKL